MITVAKDNSGDFDSIQKAVDSVSDNNNETIFIKKGIYKERIEIRKNNITLIGEEMCIRDSNSTTDFSICHNKIL